ncbi:MAG: aminodeoxychorismate synthase component I [Balneolales bacterium]
MHERTKRLIQSLRRDGPLIFLDSQSSDHPASQKSYIASSPDSYIEAYGDRIIIRQPDGRIVESKGNPWEALKRFRKTYPGWHFGWFGYDLKNYTENLRSCNPDLIGLPDLFFIRPGNLFEIDPVSNHLQEILGGVSKITDEGLDEGPAMVSNLISSVAMTDYLEVVRQAKRLIKEGDFYEINLSHQLTAEYSGDSLNLYDQMRQRGPVPFGAYIHRKDAEICCASPERFLRKEGNCLTSEPIKGTIRRGINEAEDSFLKNELRNSAKNKAENLMIVDLVRNDLSRIARQGSVSVEKLFELQTFSTLHQMVSTITAEIEAGTDPIDAIQACFPMGSMTGAPKIKSMEHIENLESYNRGLYSGGIGYFTPNDDFDFNVVIRTAIVKDSKLYYSIGGAITADSDPQDEWQETWVKARALTDVPIMNQE